MLYGLINLLVCSIFKIFPFFFLNFFGRLQLLGHYPLLGLRRGFYWRNIIPVVPELNHIRHWHHYQLKTLR